MTDEELNELETKINNYNDAIKDYMQKCDKDYSLASEKERPAIADRPRILSMHTSKMAGWKKTIKSIKSEREKILAVIAERGDKIPSIMIQKEQNEKIYSLENDFATLKRAVLSMDNTKGSFALMNFRDFVKARSAADTETANSAPVVSSESLSFPASNVDLNTSSDADLNASSSAKKSSK